MRPLKWLVLVTVLGLVGQPAAGQRGERRIGPLMDRLREELWAYRQELDFFRRAPEYRQLVDLRYDIREMARRMVELEDRGPQGRRMQRELARRMEDSARQLRRLTDRLEQRTDVVPAPREVRRRADRLKQRADRIREQIGRLRELVR